MSLSQEPNWLTPPLHDTIEFINKCRQLVDYEFLCKFKNSFYVLKVIMYNGFFMFMYIICILCVFASIHFS